MTNENNSAFPANAHTDTEGGLTKREYFAVMALQGILANSNYWTAESRNPVKFSVQQADFLIEELNKIEKK